MALTLNGATTTWHGHGMRRWVSSIDTYGKAVFGKVMLVPEV